MAAFATTIKRAFSGIFSHATEEEKQKRYVAQQIAYCERYAKTLRNELNKEENKEINSWINLKTYHSAGGGIRDSLATSILNSFEKSFENKDKDKKFNQKLLFRKYNVARCALDILYMQEKKGIENYKNYLAQNKFLLAQRRDDDAMTLAKVAGVAVSTVLGVGIGGYIAYHSFFGKRATEGKKLLRKSEKNSTDLQARIERFAVKK